MLENKMAYTTGRILIYLSKSSSIPLSARTPFISSCINDLLLFKNLSVESLHCEVCELVKHKCVPFPIIDKMSPSPFFLVHTDVWGPFFPCSY